MSSSRLPWLSLFIPLGYLPGYLTGSRPGVVESLVIVGATLVAWFLVFAGTRHPALVGRGSGSSAGMSRAGNLLWPLTLLIAAALFAFLITPASLARVEAFGRKEAWSVGIFQQALWWTGHGVPLGATYGTVDGSLHSQFGVHFSPFFLLFEPIYRWRPEPSTLLALQAAFLGLATLPLFALARRRIGAAGAGLLGLAWLLQPIVIGAPLTGFHDLAFAPFFLFAAFWAMSRERGFLYIGSILALMSIREDLSILVIALGGAAMFLKAPGRYALGSILLGGAWLFVAIVGVMPGYRTAALLAGPEVFLAQYLGAWGATPTDIAINMATHPLDFLRQLASREALLYLLTLLRPIGFLAPLPDPSWVAAIPSLFLNMVSEGTTLKSPLGRYSLPVAAAFFAALPGALAFWGRKLGQPARIGGIPGLGKKSMEERGALLKAEAHIGNHWRSAEAGGNDSFELEEGRRGAPLVLMILVAALLALYLMPIGPQFRPELAATQMAPSVSTMDPSVTLTNRQAALAEVPPEAGVLAPDWAYARLANRALYACVGSLEARALDEKLLDRFEAVVIDMSPGSFELSRYPTLLPALLARLRADRAYREVASTGGISTFVRAARVTPAGR